MGFKSKREADDTSPVYVRDLSTTGEGRLEVLGLKRKEGKNLLNGGEGNSACSE